MKLTQWQSQKEKEEEKGANTQVESKEFQKNIAQTSLKK